MVDIIVIGSGFAGLSAAIEAAQTGCSVVVLEKTATPGGNSRLSDGGIAAPGTRYQEQAEISDSPQLMYHDMLTAGHGLNYPELVRTVTDHALEAFRWTRDELGVPYMDRVDIFGGHSVPRCYTPEGISGAPLINRQLSRLEDLQVPVRTSTFVHALETNGSGRVTGVTLEEGYRPGKPATTGRSRLSARRGVIVATGGFGSDVPFRRAQDPRLDQSVMSTNSPFATGEILRECLRIGANPVQLSHIQLGPWASPDERGFGAGPLFGDYLVFPYGILVDPATGKRFVSELSDRNKLAEAILAREQPVVGITDSMPVETVGWDISRALKKKVVRSYETMEELAAAYDIDPKALTATLSRFNGMVRAGTDTDYGKPLGPDVQPLETPPFYAMRFWPKVHYTMGGVQIDTGCRVITRDQQPIPGLFAAGEITGGIHGACRLGSCAITECIVMGRIAGQEATAERAVPGPPDS